MDLIESIRIFRRVAQKASFSQVAAEFNVTQPTVSKSVAALEEKLGVTLLRRSTRGVSLTAEGQELFNSGGPLVDQMDALLVAIKNEKKLLRGLLRVTASLAFARLILAPRFDVFSKLHPQLKFHFQLSDGYVDLIENNIDVAIRIGHLEDSGLKAMKIGFSKRSFYASRDYLSQHGTPHTLESLRRHRLLFYTRLSDQSVWPLIDGNKKKLAFRFEPYLQSDGSDLIRESMLHGGGIAFLPNWMMIGHEELRISTLQKFVGSPSPIYVVTAGSQDMNAKQRAFGEFLKREFDKIPALSLERSTSQGV